MSKAFGLRTWVQPLTRQNQQIFDIYNAFRLILSLILLSSFLFGASDSVLGAHDPDLFLQAATFYVFFNLLVLGRGFIPSSTVQHSPPVIAIIIIDILMLVLLSYTCGGVSSGMAHLVVVPIAVGALLNPGRMSMFLAAVGSLAVIYSEIYLFFTLNDDNRYYVQAGLLGLTLFVTALAIQLLGGRIRQNERIAEQQAARIQSLQEMNYQIIQRMRTGILVVDPKGRILNANSSAKKLVLDNEYNHFANAYLPPVLQQQLQTWRKDAQAALQPFKLSKTEPQVQANFSYLNPEDEANILIFLEDYSRLISRVQQLKMVSLGRLTASIAHEVRNPLGAISHASQLLKESPSLGPEDHRFVEIIINHCERVNSIIENILQLSRQRAEVPALIPLEPWLEQFVTRFSHSFSQGVQIELTRDEQDIQVRFHASQLEQLMTNLCDNGVRYSLKKTGRPHLLIHTGINPRNQTPFMDVIDDGEGVGREDEEKIFEPFYTTENSGTGLGLYICREICEANQAQLVYRRTRDGRSSFRIIFAHPDRNIV